MILSKSEAEGTFFSLRHSSNVKASAVLHFNNHQKGQVTVRHSLGYGVVVEVKSASNPIPYGREVYNDEAAFFSAYNL